MCPGAGVGHIEVVAPGLGFEPPLPRGPGRAVNRHPVAERGGIAHELAVPVYLPGIGVLPDAFNQLSHWPALLVTIGMLRRGTAEHSTFSSVDRKHRSTRHVVR